LLATDKRGLHENKFQGRIDKDILSAQAAKRESAGVFGIPNLIAVFRQRRIGRERVRSRCLEPILGNDRLALPIAVIGQHQAEARPVAEHRIDVGEGNLLPGRIDDPRCIGLRA